MNLGYDDGDLEGIMELRDGFEEAVKKGDVGSFYGCLEDYCFGLSNDFKIKVKEILSDYFLRVVILNLMGVVVIGMRFRLL